VTAVEVAGTGLFPFGRHGDVSLAQMGAAAVRQALDEADEAGPASRFQAAFCATAYGGVAAGHRVLGELALTGGPIVDV
jgi:acetyl-CoA acetyltransferase